jgi:hypothetical protein
VVARGVVEMVKELRVCVITTAEMQQRQQQQQQQ